MTANPNAEAILSPPLRAVELICLASIILEFETSDSVLLLIRFTATEPLTPTVVPPGLPPCAITPAAPAKER